MNMIKKKQINDIMINQFDTFQSEPDAWIGKECPKSRSYNLMAFTQIPRSTVPIYRKPSSDDSALAIAIANVKSIAPNVLHTPRGTYAEQLSSGNGRVVRYYLYGLNRRHFLCEFKLDTTSRATCCTDPEGQKNQNCTEHLNSVLLNCLSGEFDLVVLC